MKLPSDHASTLTPRARDEERRSVPWEGGHRAAAARVGWLLCVSGAALGALGLLGWIARLPFLTTAVPGQPSMKPNTAVALVLIGVAGALRQRRDVGRLGRTLSVVAAIIVLSIGLGTLAEYALEVNLHVDRLLLLLLEGVDPAAPYPGRPSPPTALALALLSAALLIFDVRSTARSRPSEWLVLVAFFTAFVALVGFFFGAGPLYRMTTAPVTGVALPTAAGLILVSVGLLLERPNAGLMRVVTSPGPGGVMFRRLAVPAVLAPVLLGPLAEALLTSFGVADLPLVLATLTIAMTGVTLFLLIMTALPLNRVHEALERSRTRIRNLVEQAPDGIFVADLEGRYTEVNEAGCRMLGFRREEIVGKTIVDLIPPVDVGRLEREKVRLLEGVATVTEWRLRRKDGTYLPVEVSAAILPDGRWQGFVRDISERQQAHDQLRESRERLELALRGAELALWDWNVASGEVVFNARWAEMRGYRPEEIRGHVDTWISGVHPEDWPRVKQVLEEHFQGRRSEYEAEHRVRTKSGHWIWILDRGKVFARNERGEPVRMAGTELDITSRKQAEEALRLAEAKATGIVSIAADAIISIDREGRITLFNEGAEKTFGYTKAEVVGAPLDILIPERFRAIHRQHLGRFVAGQDVSRRMGQGAGAIIVGLRKSGEEFAADAAISNLEVGGERILTVVLRDITEQRRVEREERLLREVASALASTLDYEGTLGIVAHLLVRDLADVCVVEIVEEKGRVALSELACRDQGDAAVVEALRHVPLDPRYRRGGGSVFDTGQPLVISAVTSDALDAVDDEYRRVLRERGPVSFLAQPLIVHERLLGVMLLARTAGNRPFGREDLPLASEMARRVAWAVDNARLYRTALHATQLRDELLGIVAHDLRNPLNAIRMQAALLRHGGADLERRSQKVSDGIERTSIRMNRLIQNLLDLTQIEAGGLSVERAPVPVSQLVAACVEAHEPLATAGSLELRLDVESDVPDVLVDGDRLLQVLENVIGNALKFTPPGGHITVGAAREGSDVRFWVADSGAGIPAEHLAHLFDRFWQGRRTERRGAGLGLSIAKGIVELHGGRIWVESVPGRGSTFFFTMPAASAAETRAAIGADVT